MTVLLLPATTFAATALGALFLLLAATIGRRRRSAPAPFDGEGPPALRRALRARDEFVAHVPLALGLLALVEGQLGTSTFPWACALLLIGGRAAHALATTRGTAPGPASAAGTGLTVLVEGLLLIALGYQLVMESGVLLLLRT